MRKHLLSLCLMLITALANAQAPFNGNVITYHFNGTPVNGVKIKTNFPFTNGSQMPTVIFEGYNFGAGSPMGLLLSYYILNDSLTRPGVSSFGAYAPPIFMANEGGKVVIFIDSKDYYLRFNIRAFAKGMLEDPAYFTTWQIVDEALSGSATAKSQVPYKQQLAGDIYLPGGIWNRDGKVGIGTAIPGDYKLAVEGIVGARRVKVTQNTWADYVFQPGYKLPSLNEVENYIKAHQHLPEIPCATEVEKEGLDLGDINKKLLQKIEELTLYQIQQQKEHEAVLLRLKALEAQMKQMKEEEK